MARPSSHPVPKAYLSILSILVLNLGATLAFAAGENSGVAWKKSIQEVKDTTTKVVEENRKLQQEYDALQQDVAGIQDEIRRYQTDNKQKESEVAEMKKFVADKKQEASGLQGDLETLRRDIEAINAENASLKEELSQLDEIQKLWKLKVSDLEVQKSLSNLDAKMEESLLTNNKMVAQELGPLKKAWEESQSQEADLKKKLGEAMAREGELQAQLETLRVQNDDLDKEAAERKQDAEWQKHRNEQLQQEYADQERSADQEYAQKLKEKAALQKDIEGLERQADELKSSVDGYEKLQKKKRALIDEIIGLDQANQDLRGQIQDLKDEISMLRKEAEATQTRMRSQIAPAPSQDESVSAVQKPAQPNPKISDQPAVSSPKDPTDKK